MLWFKEPATRLLDKVYHKIEKLYKKTTKIVFDKFPEAESEIYDVLVDDLTEKKNVCRELIDGILECNENYVFTNDPDFINGALDEEKKHKPKKGYIDASDLLVNTLRSRLDQYGF